jgi:hypothetical protein
MVFFYCGYVGVLTGSPNPNNYWKVLKNRLKKEGSQLVTNCNQLKMQSADGKFYKTDVADTEQLFRLIQSIPSPKAEPFKLWLAQVASEKEGSQLVTNCNQLKMQSADGKFYKTDVADTEQLFRLIQSIPSPKAEPFKLWLAQVASERLDEMQDPELTIDRALEQYLHLGYSILKTG